MVLRYKFLTSCEFIINLIISHIDKINISTVSLPRNNIGFESLSIIIGKRKIKSRTFCLINSENSWNSHCRLGDTWILPSKTLLNSPALVSRCNHSQNTNTKIQSQSLRKPWTEKIKKLKNLKNKSLKITKEYIFYPKSRK